MSDLDQDWFYVTTEEPNQIISVNFRVPGVSTNVAAWLLSVRDKGGNTLAEFTVDSSAEVTYPVLVAAPGTYYLVLKPNNTFAIASAPYNLVASLSFSDSDAPPVDVNFFDVETEPNDEYATANAIFSSKTMYGMLHSALSGDETIGWALQAEEDWFTYEVGADKATGEIVTLAWCQREDCTPASGRAWRVTVFAQDGTIMTSFQTIVPKTVTTGLKQPGQYYIQVMAALLTDANGNIVTRCREWSIPQPGQTAECLRYVPVAGLATDQYNFTWQGTALPPNTSVTTKLGGTYP
jgi:hypothetical protein